MKEHKLSVSSNMIWFKYWRHGVPKHIEYPRISLGQMLSETVRKYPDRIAFKDENSSLTYVAFDEATDKLANYLGSSEGVKRGDQVHYFSRMAPNM